jgi:hypothetical protein
VEQDGREPIEPRLEGRFAILVPEESRVTKPGRQDTLGVARDDFRLLRLHVRHGEKGGLQLAIFIDHRKVMLVVNHRRRQHLFRQLEKFDRKMAGDDGRILDEIRYFLKQR